MHKISINQSNISTDFPLLGYVNVDLTAAKFCFPQFSHLCICVCQVRGDDQQPQQVRGARHGVEHGRPEDLHRVRGRSRHRRQRGRQQDLGQGDQERHPHRGVLVTRLQAAALLPLIRRGQSREH